MIIILGVGKASVDQKPHKKHGGKTQIRSKYFSYIMKF